MATAVETSKPAPPAPERFLFRGVGWEGYQAILKLVANRRVRVTYDRGDVELMSPLPIHERYKSLFGRMIETLTEELGSPIISVGSMTIGGEDADRALEPDECFYLASFGRLRDPDRIDLDVDPPPDLAVEIDITRSSLNKMEIYAALRIPEVWRFDGDSFRIFILQADGQYRHSETSEAFPFLPMTEFVRFVREPGTANGTLWIRNFRTWVREVVVPLARN